MKLANVERPKQGWLLAGLAGLFLAFVPAPAPAGASDLTAREVTVRLFQAAPGERLDFSDLNLSLIDLAGLDFKQAAFTGADLYGTDFTGADLSGTDLTFTRLDRSSIIKANFAGADLTDATLLRPTTFSDDTFNRADVADFTRAKLVRTRVIARLDGASFRGADLTQADFRPIESGANTISTIPHNQLTGADFTDARMHGAKLMQAQLAFARFHRADLKGTSFVNANLTKADFREADISETDFTGAALEGANFEGVKGLNSAKGLDLARIGARVE